MSDNNKDSNELAKEALDFMKDYEPTNEFIDILAETMDVSRQDIEDQIERNLTERIH